MSEELKGSHEEQLTDVNAEEKETVTEEIVAEAKPKKRKALKIVLTVVCVILAVVILLVAAAWIYIKIKLSGIERLDGTDVTLSPSVQESLNNQDDTKPDFTGPVIDATDVTTPTQPAGTITSTENIVNILLVGQDRREGEGRRHSDSMVLVTINKKDKTITMTSFMRDLWVTIPDHYTERLNVPYMVGGFPLLNDTLEYTFGVRADHNIEVDFDGFEAVIDAVGGVDIHLTAAEARYLNRRGNWTAGDTYNGEWNLTEGVNHLTGIQALAYSRIRDIDSDFGRTGRQRAVLEALLMDAKEKSATELLSLVESLIPLVKTDMTDSEILSLAWELVPILSEVEIISQRIPADGAFSNVRLIHNGYAKDVLIMDEEDLAANILLLQDALSETP